MSVIKFTVEVDGVTYQCKRETTSKRKLTQTVQVDGYGFDVDPYEYGHEQKYNPLHLMEHFGKAIARRIIREAKKSI